MFIYLPLSACVLSFLDTAVEGAPSSPSSEPTVERCTFDELNDDGTRKKCIFPFTDEKGNTYLNCMWSDKDFLGEYLCPTSVVFPKGQEEETQLYRSSSPRIYGDYKSCEGYTDNCIKEATEYCTVNAYFYEHNKKVFAPFGHYTKVEGDIAEVSLTLWKRATGLDEKITVECPHGWTINSKLPMKPSTTAARCKSGKVKDRSIHILGCMEKCEDLDGQDCSLLLSQGFGVKNLSIDQDYCSRVTKDTCESNNKAITCCPKTCDLCEKVPRERKIIKGELGNEGSEGEDWDGRLGNGVGRNGKPGDSGRIGGSNGARSMGVTMSLCAIMVLL